MLEFNFASRTFVYKRLGYSPRCASAFSSRMRNCLDPVVKLDQCAQNVDDNGIATNNATDRTRNNRAVFKCIRQASLRLTKETYHFGTRQGEVVGRTISTKFSPQARKIQNVLSIFSFSKSKKHCCGTWDSNLFSYNG